HRIDTVISRMSNQGLRALRLLARDEMRLNLRLSVGGTGFPRLSLTGELSRMPSYVKEIAKFIEAYRARSSGPGSSGKGSHLFDPSEPEPFGLRVPGLRLLWQQFSRVRHLAASA